MNVRPLDARTGLGVSFRRSRESAEGGRRNASTLRARVA